MEQEMGFRSNEFKRDRQVVAIRFPSLEDGRSKGTKEGVCKQATRCTRARASVGCWRWSSMSERKQRNAFIW